jgi:PKD repeat protein
MRKDISRNRFGTRRLKVLGLAMLLVLTVVSFVGVDNAMAGDLGGATIEWVGGYTVTSDDWYSNGTIICSGNLVITNGASLTLRNVTLLMNCTTPGQYYIEVNNGAFYIHDGGDGLDAMDPSDTDPSIITAPAFDLRYKFIVREDGVLKISNSIIELCGLPIPIGVDPSNLESHGLYVESSDVNIDRSWLAYNTVALIANHSSPTITNTYMSYNNVSVAALENSDVYMYNDTVWDISAVPNPISMIGIYSNSSNIAIVESSVSYCGYNIQQPGPGIFIENSSTVIITDSDIFNNNFVGIGIDNSTVILNGNNITDNNGYGMLITNSANVVIDNNNISDNSGYGIMCVDAHVEVLNNVIGFNMFAGLYWRSDTAINAIIKNNTFLYHEWEIFLQANGDIAATFEKNTIQMYDYGIIIFSGADTSITVDNNSISSVFLGSTGIYVDAIGNITGNFTDNNIYDNQDSGISLYSGGDINITLVNNKINNTYGPGGIGLWAYVDGDLTAELNGNKITNSTAYGTYLSANGDMTANFSKNTILDNQDGIYLQVLSSDIVVDFTDNIISNSNNNGLIIIATNNITATLTNNTINNTFSGDGVHINAGGNLSAALTENTITNSGFFGIYIQANYDITSVFTSNKIMNNALGVMMSANGDVTCTLTDNTINTTFWGDGLWINAGGNLSATLTENTITNCIWFGLGMWANYDITSVLTNNKIMNNGIGAMMSANGDVTCTLTNNVLRDNTWWLAFIVNSGGSVSATLMQNDISKNGGGGCELSAFDELFIEAESNTFIENGGWSIEAWSNNGNAEVILKNNTMLSNGGGVWVSAFGGNVTASLTSNIISRNMWGDAIGLWAGMNLQATITDNAIKYNGGFGIYMEAMENGTASLSDNEIIGNMVGLYMSAGITFTASLEGDVIAANHGWGIEAYHTDLTITDTSILWNFEGINLWLNSTAHLENCTIDNDREFFITDNSHITTLNTIFDKTKVEFGDTLSTLLIKWYLNVLVTDNFGTPISGARVVVQDLGDNEIFNGTTGLNGYVRWIVTDEYLQNSTTKMYYTAHNVTASKPGCSDGYAMPEPMMDESKTVVVTIEDSEVPIPDAGPDQIVDEDTIVTFDGSGSTDNIGIVNWTWTFDDQGTVVTLYGINPTYVFTTPGVYTVTLTARDGSGLEDTDTMQVTVKDITAPVADAGLDQTVDEDTVVTFNGSGSTDNNGTAGLTYEWDFGDGSTGTGMTTTHTYEDPGTYVVTLTVTDIAGNSDTDTMVVNVEDATSPTVEISPEDGEENVAINTTIILVFSEPMNKASVENALTISGNITYTLKWYGSDTTLVITPSEDLSYGTTYTITIASSARDIAGNFISESTIDFTTESAPAELSFLEQYWWAIIIIILVLVIIYLLATRKKIPKAVEEEAIPEEMTFEEMPPEMTEEEPLPEDEIGDIPPEEAEGKTKKK